MVYHSELIVSYVLSCVWRVRLLFYNRRYLDMRWRCASAWRLSDSIRLDIERHKKSNMETSFVQVIFFLLCLVILFIMFLCGQALQIYNKIKHRERRTLQTGSQLRRRSTTMETTLLFRIDKDVYTIHIERDEDEVIPRADSACDFYVPMSLMAT